MDERDLLPPQLIAQKASPPKPESLSRIDLRRTRACMRHSDISFSRLLRPNHGNVCKTASRDSKPRQFRRHVVTEGAIMRRDRGPHTHTDNTKGDERKKKKKKKKEEIMFHVETLREDLAVCCSNIRSLCLMRFLLYRGLGSTDDLFLDASRPREREREICFDLLGGGDER